MSLNVSLLRASFALVAERQPHLTRRFYEILFERYPQAAALFSKGAGARQEEMLTQALVALMDHLEDVPWLMSTLAGLGAKHVAYRVSDEMYEWVGECLIATLAEVAGADWTPELAAAWSDAYGAIAGMMLSGAHAARMRRRTSGVQTVVIPPSA
jgi:hemoglobin-like flavoprotein